MQAVAAAVAGVCMRPAAASAKPAAGASESARAHEAGASDLSAEELLEKLRSCRSEQRRRKKERRKNRSKPSGDEKAHRGTDKAGEPAEHRAAEAAPEGAVSDTVMVAAAATVTRLVPPLRDVAASGSPPGKGAKLYVSGGREVELSRQPPRPRTDSADAREILGIDNISDDEDDDGGGGC